MKADFICDYLLNTGKFCGKACTKPEGCRTHIKARKRRPCSVCGKPTWIANGRCSNCNKSNYQIQYVDRLWVKARLLEEYLPLNYAPDTNGNPICLI